MVALEKKSPALRGFSSSARRRRLLEVEEAAQLLRTGRVTQLAQRFRLYLPQGSARDVLRRNLDGSGQLVVVEITNGSTALSSGDLKELGNAFGLTSAETSILGSLASGGSLAEIADERGVAIETVRSQCKKLLAKTRSRRQSDLVKLVVALCTQTVAVAAE